MAKDTYQVSYEFPRWVGERFKDEADRRAEIEGSYSVFRLLIDYAKTLAPSRKEGSMIPGPEPLPLAGRASLNTGRSSQAAGPFPYAGPAWARKPVHSEPEEDVA
jgi:hypothetical protein